MTPSVKRVGAIGLNVGVADHGVAPAARQDLAGHGRLAGVRVAAARSAPGRTGRAARRPPPKFTSRITGTGRVAPAGVYDVEVDLRRVSGRADRTDDPTEDRSGAGGRIG